MRRPPAPVVSVVALALLVAGCGSPEPAASDGHDHAENSPVVDGARELAVTGKDLRFTPARLEVAAGEDVTIVFTAADVAHDFTIEGAGVHVGAAAGQTARGGLRIDEPGTYTFVCTVAGHATAGMTGTLTVTEA
ncbi:MAG TPA: cupredoxin domain-containing protein [Egibacteraceae bacterium]|nr:cupredoxin domain-containing protein [Egibacteraceae bacterium]